MADNEKQGGQMTSEQEPHVLSFSEAAERARHVMYVDKKGLFTCHTADPYVDAMAAAHDREVRAPKEEVAQPRALLRGLKRIARSVPTESLHAPWVANGRHVYPKAVPADYGDLVATFEDVDGMSAGETVCAVNAFIELRDHLDKHFRDEPQGAERQ